MTWTIYLTPSGVLNQEAMDRDLIRDGLGPIFSDSPADAFRHTGASMIATYYLGADAAKFIGDSNEIASVGCVLARTTFNPPRPAQNAA